MLATSQETDKELSSYNEGKSGLRLEKIDIAGTFKESQKVVIPLNETP